MKIKYKKTHHPGRGGITMTRGEEKQRFSCLVVLVSAAVMAALVIVICGVILWRG